MTSNTIKKQMKTYCAKIGADPLLVQGAGGNASWKDGKILWVKASGTWLANAEKDEIFIPVDLANLKDEISKGNFWATPKLLTSQIVLKPSIETILHALMPDRLVIHIHAIEALVHLVRQDFKENFKSVIDKSLSYCVIDYFKPGADLASAIYDALAQSPSVDILFLKNHGIVIGGENIIDIDKILKKLTNSLITTPVLKLKRDSSMLITKPSIFFHDKYDAITDQCIHQLALDPIMYSQLQRNWALYPDHVVFLGAKPFIYDSWSSFEDEAMHSRLFPEIVFIKNNGVFVKKSFTQSKKAQLRCYFDVMVRQKADIHLNTLTDNQISELLNWEAEQYRMSLED